MPGVRLRYTKPKHPGEDGGEPTALRKTSRITIKHPGYQGSSSALLTLPATDGQSHDSAHYETVRIACAILADNTFDGWLSASQTGEPRLQPDSDGLVDAGTYYFHVPAHHVIHCTTANAADPPNLEYHVVPNFRSWRFPHQCLPTLWKRACESETLDDSVHAPQTCRLTLTSHARVLQKSHIIPSSEKSWFAENDMHQYGTLSGRGGQDVADMPNNHIRLRCDIHQLWDGTEFSIVPKRDQNGTEVWTAHAMSEDPELLALYHNVPFHLLNRPAEFFLARYAMDLFPKALGFLQTQHPRWLAVPLANGEVERRLFSKEECRAFGLNQGRGRSTSPTKRSHSELDGAGSTDCDLHIRNNRKRRRQFSLHAKSLDSAVSDSQRSSRAESLNADQPIAVQCGCWDCWIGRTAHSKKGRHRRQESPDLPGERAAELSRGRKRMRSLEHFGGESLSDCDT